MMPFISDIATKPHSHAATNLHSYIATKPESHIATQPQREAAFGRLDEGGAAFGCPSFVEPFLAI